MSVPLDRWMSALGASHPEILTKNLEELRIPGTHNAATSVITAERVPLPLKEPWLTIAGLTPAGVATQTVLARWARTQDLTVAGQLVHGARYFDLRPCYKAFDGEIYQNNHGPCLGEPMRAVLTSVRDFIDADTRRSGEVVFLHFKNMFTGFSGQDSFDGLWELVWTILGDKLYPNTAHGGVTATSVPTMGQMWDAGKQVILQWDDTTMPLQTIESADPREYVWKSVMAITLCDCPTVSGMYQKLFGEGAAQTRASSILNNTWALPAVGGSGCAPVTVAVTVTSAHSDATAFTSKRQPVRLRLNDTTKPRAFSNGAAAEDALYLSATPTPGSDGGGNTPVTFTGLGLGRLGAPLQVHSQHATDMMEERGRGVAARIGKLMSRSRIHSAGDSPTLITLSRQTFETLQHPLASGVGPSHGLSLSSESDLARANAIYNAYRHRVAQVIGVPSPGSGVSGHSVISGRSVISHGVDDPHTAKSTHRNKYPSDVIQKARHSQSHSHHGHDTHHSHHATEPLQLPRGQPGSADFTVGRCLGHGTFASVFELMGGVPALAMASKDGGGAAGATGGGGGGYAPASAGQAPPMHRRLAVKVEKARRRKGHSRGRHGHSHKIRPRYGVSHEYKVYRVLEGVPGVPSVLNIVEHGDQRLLIMDLLGPSLKKLATNSSSFVALQHGNSQKPPGLSTEAILRVAYKLMFVLRDTHRRAVVHRDVKPGNIAVSLDGLSLKLIDFGIAKNLGHDVIKAPAAGLGGAGSSSTSDTGSGPADPAGHCPPQKGRKTPAGLRGTVLYASSNSHQGIPLGPRDDLESLVYTLVRLSSVTGSLPWERACRPPRPSSKASTREMAIHRAKYIKAIGKLKQSLSPDEVCEHMPSSVRTILEHAKGLGQYQLACYEELLLEILQDCSERGFDPRDSDPDLLVSWERHNKPYSQAAFDLGFHTTATSSKPGDGVQVPFLGAGPRPFSWTTDALGSVAHNATDSTTQSDTLVTPGGARGGDQGSPRYDSTPAAAALRVLTPKLFVSFGSTSWSDAEKTGRTPQTSRAAPNPKLVSPRQARNHHHNRDGAHTGSGEHPLARVESEPPASTSKSAMPSSNRLRGKVGSAGAFLKSSSRKVKRGASGVFRRMKKMFGLKKEPEIEGPAQAVNLDVPVVADSSACAS